MTQAQTRQLARDLAAALGLSDARRARITRARGEIRAELSAVASDKASKLPTSAKVVTHGAPALCDDGA